MKWCMSFMKPACIRCKGAQATPVWSIEEIVAVMWKQYLKSTVQYLVIFEKVPKNIEGRKITKWITVGENIFIELHRLGESVKWDYAIIKKEADISDIIAHFTKNKEWLQSFITIYPTLKIDLDGVGFATDICMVRSGLEVLLQGFANIDPQFDKVLKDLQEFGEVSELDRCLKIWRESGHRPEFAPGNRSGSTPESHWWWH